jgi:hypothetical protein
MSRMLVVWTNRDRVRAVRAQLTIPDVSILTVIGDATLAKAKSSPFD